MKNFKVIEKGTNKEFVVLNFEPKSEAYLLVHQDDNHNGMGYNLRLVETTEMVADYLFKCFLDFDNYEGEDK